MPYPKIHLWDYSAIPEEFSKSRFIPLPFISILSEIVGDIVHLIVSSLQIN